MIGRTIGRYRILALLGSGGMGLVYRARDDTLERDVAIKVLPDEGLGDTIARARLLREARSAAALNHPNICTIYEAGEIDGLVFIAMELVEGRSLDQIVPPDGLSRELVLRYGTQIAEALAYAHDRGVVHRDLKAANVMVADGNRVKVLDFGVARRMPTDGAPTTVTMSLTDTGAVVGTAAYLPPEVLLGQRADSRSDLWAFGVLLQEMATGRRPFAGETAFEVGAAILHAEPHPLPDAVPPGLRTTILRCLEKDPAQRWQRAEEIRHALEAASLEVATPALPAQPRSVPGAHRRATPTVNHAAGRHWPAMVSILMALLVALTLITYVNMRRRVTGTKSLLLRSIAVLPLENLSHDSEQDYLADGMTEELITELTKLGALRVIAATSVQGFRGTRAPVTEIARRLGVGTLVLGSVLKSGDRVRVTARLVQAADQRQLWADSYDRDLRDVLGLQGEVALAIVRGVQARLTPVEHQHLTTRPPVDPTAYQECLRGRYFLKRFTEQDLARADEHFRLALAADPAYAPAYAAIADRYYEASSVWMAPREASPKARAAALQSLALDSTLAEAYCSLAVVDAFYDHDWAAAERGFRRAIALNPGYALAHQRYGYWLSVMGRSDEAISEIRKAVAADPLSQFTACYEGMLLLFARRAREGIHVLEQTALLDTSFYMPHIFLGLTLAHAGEAARAVAEMETGTRLDNNLQGLAQKGWVYATANRRADAQAVIETIQRRARSEGEFFPEYDVALIDAQLGDLDAAFRHLERAYDEVSEALLWIKVDPRADRLRSDPRYSNLIHRLKLDAS